MAINFRKVTSTILLSFSLPIVSAGTFTWFDGSAPVSYAIETKTDLVVGTAAGMFESDMEAVTGKPAVTDKRNPTIRLTQLDKASKSQRRKLIAAGVPVESLDTLTDGFHISTDGKSILVVGSNGRGTAYGLLELSRMAGVSPWIWWGDMVPEKKERLELDSDFSITKGASVEYRGVFLNDEDWSLRPWSFGTYEPAEPGTIGPKTYKRIFELLMRLRGNAVWGAMHEGTKAFFSNPANKLVADSCGIAVGSSHCEPLLRNNVGEWDVKKLGRYNYMTNRDAVHSYWSERLDEVKNSQGGNIFTIGMRGIHDSSMEGVKTTDEKFHALQQVIDDQQKLIAEHVGRPDRQMQVFIPYKEV
ncbi:MAG: glycosyl hydrolase 115 family protein, partial [Duncaniella sp.]|nr:glycosyl hydrolase 115 family protein [Duncaniella sp.]